MQVPGYVPPSDNSGFQSGAGDKVEKSKREGEIPGTHNPAVENEVADAKKIDAKGIITTSGETITNLERKSFDAKLRRQSIGESPEGAYDEPAEPKTVERKAPGATTSISETPKEKPKIPDKFGPFPPELAEKFIKDSKAGYLFSAEPKTVWKAEPEKPATPAARPRDLGTNTLPGIARRGPAGSATPSPKVIPGEMVEVSKEQSAEKRTKIQEEIKRLEARSSQIKEEGEKIKKELGDDAGNLKELKSSFEQRRGDFNRKISNIKIPFPEIDETKLKELIDAKKKRNPDLNEAEIHDEFKKLKELEKKVDKVDEYSKLVTKFKSLSREIKELKAKLNKLAE